MNKKLLILLFASTLATTTFAFGVEDAIATLAGFMAAIVHKDNLTEMLTCATDAETITTDVELLIRDIESLSFSGFFNAIVKTGEIIGEAPFILKECENLKEDLNTMMEQAKVFTNIGELTERITKNYVWHYTEIMTDIDQAKTDAAQGEYYSFGEAIGDAVFVALQP